MDISSVARRAKVSTATVSRVLNDSDKVRESTAARVRKAIDDLKYIPNSSARVLRSGRSRLYGIIVSDIRNPFFPDLIEHFESLAMDHGIDVMFANTGYSEERLLRCVQKLLERVVDGIAILTSEVSPLVLKKIKNTNVPVVFLNQRSLGNQFCSVKVDYLLGFRDAIYHLRKLGHQRIGFVSGPPSLSSAVCRREAFLAAIDTSHLPLEEDWILQGDHKISGGVEAMHTLLTLRGRPTAIVCSNDLTAAGMLRVAVKEQVRIPQDLSLVGFDDLSLTELLQPQLTTVHLSRQEIATRAFFKLYAWSGSGSRPARMSSIVPKLVVRSSTSAPA